MSSKQHRHSRGKKILSNIMAVAMLTGAAVVGVGVGGAGVATAALAGSTSFNALDGTLGASDLAHSIDVNDKVAPDDLTAYGSKDAKEDKVCPGFSNSSPGKADIEHFYVGKEVTATDTFLYLAWNR